MTSHQVLHEDIVIDRMGGKKVARMSELEREAIKHFSSLFFEEILPVAYVLRKNSLIDETCYELILEMQNRGEIHSEIKNALITGLVNNCTFDELIKSLYDNYFIHLAKKLFFCKLQCQNNMTVVRVYKSETTYRRKNGELFKRLKQCVQDKVFDNPCAFIRDVCERKREKISKTNNDQERMRLCDEYIILKSVEMDACTNTTLQVSKDHPGYLEIETFIENTSNKPISEVLLYSRQSIALSTTDQFDEAENMIKKALMCADTSGTCPEITDMLYKSVVVKLSILGENPNDEQLMNSILYDCNRGLWTLQEESEDVCTFWKKAFLIRMAFAHLGIGKSCRIMKNYFPKKRYIVEAERLLQDDILTNLEDRRRMLMAVAKARLNEFQRNVEQALFYLSRAISLAIEGKYAEINNLVEYEKFLKMIRIEQTKKTTLFGAKKSSRAQHQIFS